MSNAVDALVWQDTLSPRNVDTCHYKVKRPFNITGYSFKAGDTLTVWAQGERFININGRLTAYCMKNVREWQQAELIFAW